MPRPDDNLFVCISKVMDPDALQKQFPTHLNWVKRQDQEGRVVATGARVPFGTGGVQIFAAANLDEMESVLETDPLVRNGAVANEIFEFQMNDLPYRSLLMKQFFGNACEKSGRSKEEEES